MKLNFLQLILCSIFIYGCSPIFIHQNQKKRTNVISHYQYGELIKKNQEQYHIPGLNSLTTQKDTINGSIANEVIDIFLVHGIGTKTDSSYNSFMDKIALELNFVQKPVVERYVTGNKNDVELITRTFTRKVNSSFENQYLRFIYVLWSPISDPHKEFIVHNYNEFVDKKIKGKRNTKIAKFNTRLVKKSIMQDNFVDIAVMLNLENQKKIYESFEKAILLSEYHPKLFDENLQKLTKKDIGGFKYKKVIISGSFGSKLVSEFLIDYYSVISIGKKINSESSLQFHRTNSNTLLQIEMDDWLLEDYERYYQGLMNTKYNWYLMSNQLSLLSTVDFKYSLMIENGLVLNSHIDYDNSFASTNEFEFNYMSSNSFLKTNRLDIEARLAQNTNLISFYDPNDFLCYYVPGKKVNSTSNNPDEDSTIYARNVWNILSPNAKTIILGGALPTKTHTGPWKNKGIIQILCSGKQLGKNEILEINN